jgi:hypothetical protein
MNGSMNGKPCWSPAARTRVFEFGGALEPDDEREAILAEAAELVRAGIKAGLVEAAETPREAKVPKKEKYGTGWRFINCSQCRIGFFRGNIGITKCAVCRLGTRICFCGKTFQPLQNKAQSCSAECSKARQIATFRAKHGADTKPVILAECIICKEMKPRRQSGATFARTCSKECASVYRKQKATEHNQAKAEARKNENQTQ